LDLQNGDVRGLFTDIAKQPDIFFNALEEQFGYPIPQAERDAIVTAIHRAKNIEPQALATDAEEAPAALDAVSEAIPHEDATAVEITSAPKVAAGLSSDPEQSPAAIVTVGPSEAILDGKGISAASPQPAPDQKTECGEKVAAFFAVMERIEKQGQIKPATIAFAIRSMNRKVDDAKAVETAFAKFRDEHVITPVLVTIIRHPADFLLALEKAKRRTNGSFSIPNDLKEEFQSTLKAAVYAVLEPQYQKFTDMVRPSHSTADAIGPTLDVAGAAR
jgi:hypothetical protein